MQTGSTIEGRRAGPTAAICTRPAALIAKFAAAVVMSCMSANVSAVEMEGLYTVQVPLDTDESDARSFAYQTALTEVLVRITGTTAIVESEQIAELFPNPGRYVQRFQPGPDDSLIVSLDGTAIENVLRRAGASIWDSDRPLTLVWIAVDWGQGQREIIAADDPERRPGDARSIDRNRMLRERVAKVARRRGIPVVFPLLDIEDLENISFTDIWGGFDDALLLASSRYEADTVLVGRIRPESRAANRWTWYLGDERMHWSGTPEEVINLLADTMAARFKVDSTAPLDTIRLTISGIKSVNAFGKVQRYMENLRGVDEIMIDTVAGDRIVYNIRIQGGIERLERALESNAMLEPVDRFGMDDQRNRYETINARNYQRTTIEYLYRAE